MSTTRTERLDRVRADIEPDVAHALFWIRNGGPSDYDLSEALHYLERSAALIRNAQNPRKGDA